jgi:iron complex outermembrane receptor protein
MKNFYKLALASSAMAMCAPGLALAQVTAADVDEVVVVGSRAAPRVISDSAAPVDVFSSKTLERQGYSDLSRSLQAIAPSLNFTRASTAPSAANTRPATLRGLGPDQVLVLINGKRRHASSVINFNQVVGKGTVPTDLNTIPVTAISRVEILRDGAAAQYGSDAIAGVINIVLRSDTSGGFASLQGGATSKGDGQTFIAAGLFGHSLGEDGHVTVSGEVRSREPVNRGGLDSRFNRITSRQGDPDSVDTNIVIDAATTVGGVELYGDATFADRHSVSPAQFRTPTVAPAAYPAGFIPLIALDLTDVGATLGGRGQAAGWTWDLSDTVGYNRSDFDVSNTITTSLPAGSPTRFNAGGARYTQNLIDLSASRKFDVLAGANLAVGVEHRWEGYKIVAGEPGSFSGAGAQGFPGFNPPSPVDVHRNAFSAFADGEVSPTTWLRLGAAVRYENYDDFGAKTVGKLSAFIKATDWLAFRGTASTGFRAPALQQQVFATVTSQSVGGVLVNVGTFAVDDPVSRSLGARPLKPETSKNVSAGVVLTPGPFTFTADIYQIEIADRIVLSESLQGAAVTAVLRAAGVTNASQVRYFTNAVDTTTRGLDLTAQWRGQLWEGARLDLSAAYTAVDTDIDRTRVNTLVPSLPYLGISSIDLLTKAQPRNKLSLSGQLDMGRLRLFGNVVRQGAYRSFNILAEQTFTAKTTVDLTADYDVTSRVSVTAGVINLTDTYPDKNAERALNQGGSLQYGEIGGIGIDGREYFVRLKVSF